MRSISHMCVLCLFSAYILGYSAALHLAVVLYVNRILVWRMWPSNFAHSPVASYLPHRHSLPAKSMFLPQSAPLTQQTHTQTHTHTYVYNGHYSHPHTHTRIRQQSRIHGGTPKPANCAYALQTAPARSSKMFSNNRQQNIYSNAREKMVAHSLPLPLPPPPSLCAVCVLCTVLPSSMNKFDLFLLPSYPLKTYI